MESGAAEKASNVKDLPIIANRILLSQEVHVSMKCHMNKIRKPDAASKIVEIVLEELTRT